jgi:hypothetical protein
MAPHVCRRMLNKFCCTASTVFLLQSIRRLNKAGMLSGQHSAHCKDKLVFVVYIVFAVYIALGMSPDR